MTNKYIDLAERIWRTDNGRTSYASVGMVLEWLDRHPDQVPGRTITESEFNAAVAMHESNRLTHAEQVALILRRFGITVVPDPEPTNAEKLRADIDAFYGQSVAELADGHGLEHFLSKRGWTKAGGDDE